MTCKNVKIIQDIDLDYDIEKTIKQNIFTVDVKLPSPPGLTCPRKIFMKENSVNWGRVQENFLKAQEEKQFDTHGDTV